MMIFKFINKSNEKIEKVPLRKYLIKRYLKKELIFISFFICVFIFLNFYFVNNIKEKILKNLPNTLLNIFEVINKKLELIAKVYESKFFYAVTRVENAIYFDQEINSLVNLIYKENFSEDFLRLDYYLIRKDGIVYKTSYSNDWGLDLSQFEDFWSSINENLRNKEYYLKIHSMEYSTGLKRIYIFKKIRDGSILGIGGIVNPKIYEEDFLVLTKLSIFVEQISVLFDGNPISIVFDYPPEKGVTGYEKLYKNEYWFEVKSHNEVFKIYLRTNFYALLVMNEIAILFSIALIFFTIIYLRKFTNEISSEIDKIESAVNEYGNNGIVGNEYSSIITEIDDALKTFVDLSEVITANIEEITATSQELEASYMEIQVLSKEIQEAFYDFSFKLAYIVEGFEEGTGKHLTRVRTVVEKIAEKIIDNPKFREEIAYYSVLHDIGKIFIPREILNKPGSLSPEEWEEMKKHTIYAEKVLNHPRFKTALNIAMYHHENYDGTGYPYGLVGEEIPIEARIVKIADVYDALTSERPYKKAFSKEEALRIMFEGDQRLNPKHFDPKILEVFKSIVDEL